MSSLVKRVMQNMVDLPWDKLFPGLMTGLLIYMGAAKISDLGETVTQLRIGMARYEALQHEYVTRDEFLAAVDKQQVVQFQHDLNEVRLEESLKRQILALELQLKSLHDSESY